MRSLLGLMLAIPLAIGCGNSTKDDDGDDEWGDEDENYFVCHFDTAWSPPEGIIHKLREDFPDLHISCFYDEPGMELAGYL